MTHIKARSQLLCAREKSSHMNCEGCGITRVWTSTGADRFCTYSTNSLNSASFRRVRAKSQIARARTPRFAPRTQCGSSLTLCPHQSLQRRSASSTTAPANGRIAALGPQVTSAGGSTRIMWRRSQRTTLVLPRGAPRLARGPTALRLTKSHQCKASRQRKQRAAR